MVYDFKVSDASKHVWSMFIVNSKTYHNVNVISPSGANYYFVWRDGELVHVSARGKIFRPDGKCLSTQSNFRDVISLVPMWILKKIDFYYKVHIAE